MSVLVRAVIAFTFIAFIISLIFGIVSGWYGFFAVWVVYAILWACFLFIFMLAGILLWIMNG